MLFSEDPKLKDFEAKMDHLYEIQKDPFDVPIVSAKDVAHWPEARLLSHKDIAKVFRAKGWLPYDRQLFNRDGEKCRVWLLGGVEQDITEKALNDLSEKRSVQQIIQQLYQRSAT